MIFCTYSKYVTLDILMQDEQNRQRHVPKNGTS